MKRIFIVFFAFVESYYMVWCSRPWGVHVCVGSYKSVDTVEAGTNGHDQTDTCGLLLSVSLQAQEVERWMRSREGFVVKAVRFHHLCF